MTFIKVLSGNILLLTFYGCATYSSTCPHFVTPSQEVLDKIKTLNSPEVDIWLEEMYKLNKKLKFCRGE